MAELQAYRQSQLHDKKSLAIATLVEGRPQAYVDFFYLTHSNPPNASVASAQQHGTVMQQAPDADGELPQESLGLLRAQLIRAEAASKAGGTGLLISICHVFSIHSVTVTVMSIQSVV